MNTLLSTLSLAFCILVMHGCGQSEETVAGIEGTGEKINTVVAQGTVTGFGSIYVNGVHFNTDKVSVQIDQEPAQETDLDVGMVVEVIGQLSLNGTEGVAHEVYAERILQGTVQSVDEVAAGRKVLHVLGQMVFVNDDASFNGVRFDELMSGTKALISGFVAGNGMITATHIQAGEEPNGRMVVDGYISSLDSANQIIALNDLTINSQGATFTKGGFAQLEAGSRIKVVGRLNEENQQFDAEIVQLRESKAAVENYRVVEGIMQMREGGWWIGELPVEFTNAQIENGSKDDVLAGSHVVVYGQVKVGVLFAEKLIIKSLNTNRFNAAISAIDEQASTITLLDTTIKITAFTQLKDESSLMDRHFHFNSLRLGEDVEIFAVRVSGQWQATRVIRRDHDEKRPHLLRGTAIITESSTTFYIDNIAVDGSGLSDESWQLLRNQEPPNVVEVEGQTTGDGQFFATLVRIPPTPGCDPHVFFNCKKNGDQVGPLETDRPPIR